MPTSTPRLAWPPKIVAGQFQTVDQDTPEHLEQQVALVLSTPAGALVDQFAFGRPNPEFRDPRQNAEPLRAAARKWTDAPVDIIDAGLARFAQTLNVTVGQ